MKELSYDQYSDCIKKLEEIESTLSYTILDDEALLINHLKSYLMMRYSKLREKKK